MRAIQTVIPPASSSPCLCCLFPTSFTKKKNKKICTCSVNYGRFQEGNTRFIRYFFFLLFFSSDFHERRAPAALPGCTHGCEGAIDCLSCGGYRFLAMEFNDFFQCLASPLLVKDVLLQSCLPLDDCWLVCEDQADSDEAGRLNWFGGSRCQFCWLVLTSASRFKINSNQSNTMIAVCSPSAITVWGDVFYTQRRTEK